MSSKPWGLVHKCVFIFTLQRLSCQSETWNNYSTQGPAPLSNLPVVSDPVPLLPDSGSSGAGRPRISMNETTCSVFKETTCLNLWKTTCSNLRSKWQNGLWFSRPKQWKRKEERLESRSRCGRGRGRRRGRGESPSVETTCSFILTTCKNHVLKPRVHHYWPRVK